MSVAVQGCSNDPEDRPYIELGELGDALQGASKIEVEIEDQPGQTHACLLTSSKEKARIISLLNGRIERLPHEEVPSVWGKAILKVRKKGTPGPDYDFILATIDEHVFVGVLGMGRSDEFDFHGRLKSRDLFTFLISLCGSPNTAPTTLKEAAVP